MVCWVAVCRLRAANGVSHAGRGPVPAGRLYPPPIGVAPKTSKPGRQLREARSAAPGARAAYGLLVSPPMAGHRPNPSRLQRAGPLRHQAKRHRSCRVLAWARCVTGDRSGLVLIDVGDSQPSVGVGTSGEPGDRYADMLIALQLGG